MEEYSELLKRLTVMELKIDAIFRKLTLSTNEENDLMSGIKFLLEEARARKNADYVEGGMRQMECTVVNMLSKVNGRGVNRHSHKKESITAIARVILCIRQFSIM